MGPLAMAPGQVPLSIQALVHLPTTAPPISATPQSVLFSITWCCLHMGRHDNAFSGKRLSSCYAATTRAFSLWCGEHTVSVVQRSVHCIDNLATLLHALLLAICEGNLGHEQLVLYCYGAGVKTLVPACLSHIVTYVLVVAHMRSSHRQASDLSGTAACPQPRCSTHWRAQVFGAACIHAFIFMQCAA